LAADFIGLLPVPSKSDHPSLAVGWVGRKVRDTGALKTKTWERELAIKFSRTEPKLC